MKDLLPIKNPEKRTIHRTVRQDCVKNKRIRSLTKKEDKVSKKKAQKNIDFKILLLSAILIVISFFVYQLRYGSCGFWIAYEKNYNKIFYSDQFYCHRKINSTNIINNLSEQVINQDDAIKLLNASFELANIEEFIQISLSGETGVGKSLATNIIANNFQWHGKNIQRYSYEIHDMTKLSLKIISRVSKCGFNLIIIDDLVSSELVIEKVIHLENEIRNFAKRNEYKVILITVFNGYIDEKKQEDMHFVQIQFEKFTHDALIKCIEIHQKLYNIVLEQEEINELQELNYTSSGCKQVQKRLNLIYKNK